MARVKLILVNHHVSDRVKFIFDLYINDEKYVFNRKNKLVDVVEYERDEIAGYFPVMDNVNSFSFYADSMDFVLTICADVHQAILQARNNDRDCLNLCSVKLKYAAKQEIRVFFNQVTDGND